jgi:hypothetical protein
MTELSSIAYQPKPEPAIDPNDTSPRLRLGRLKAPTQDSRWKMFVSNIKEFMTERPVKIKGGKPTPFDNPGFGDSFQDNLKEFWKPGVRGNVNSELLVDWNQNFGGFWQNIKDWLNPPKMAPWKGDRGKRYLVEGHAILARAGDVTRDPRAGDCADRVAAVARVILTRRDERQVEY